ncbi:glycosyltransferase [Roseibium sp.]|uniref:glycosyltransferase n=1 Tax=Roseibium sp. TaxID=1936156 RepID=UPI003B50ED87
MKRLSPRNVEHPIDQIALETLVDIILNRTLSKNSKKNEIGKPAINQLADTLTSDEFLMIIDGLVSGEPKYFEDFAIKKLSPDQIWVFKSIFLPETHRRKISSKGVVTRLQFINVILNPAFFPGRVIEALNKKRLNSLQKLWQIHEQRKLSLENIRRENRNLVENRKIEIVNDIEIIPTKYETARLPENFRIAKVKLKRQSKAHEYGDAVQDEEKFEMLVDLLLHASDIKFLDIVKDILKCKDDVLLMKLHNCGKFNSIRSHKAVYLALIVAGSCHRSKYFQLAEEVLSKFIFGDGVSFLKDSEYIEMMKLFARTKFRLGQKAIAVSILQDLLVTYPGDIETHYLLGTALFFENKQAALIHLKIVGNSNNFNGRMKAHVADLLRQCNNDEYIKVLSSVISNDVLISDHYLLMSNHYIEQNQIDESHKSWDRFFSSFGLIAPYQGESDQNNLFGIPRNSYSSNVQHPLVTIIMTAHNSADTIGSAIKSVMDQTCSNIEIYIVDDSSTDNTVEIVKQLKEHDQGIKLLINSENHGTYCAKNKALAISAGEFVTFHDSDDWMHPQRVELHLKAMEDATIGFCWSNWIRCEADRQVRIMPRGQITHTNPASTFFRREVLDRVGFFDSVRTGADTEFLQRVKRVFGGKYCAELNAPLAVGLSHENSLTRTGPSAIDANMYSPVRNEYWKNFFKWHEENQGNPNNLYIPAVQYERKFTAPDDILP